jgi:hypothetical protein
VAADVSTLAQRFAGLEQNAQSVAKYQVRAFVPGTSGVCNTPWIRRHSERNTPRVSARLASTGVRSMRNNDGQHDADKQSRNGSDRSKSSESGNWGSSDSDGQNEDESGRTSGPSSNPNGTNGNTKGDPTR